MSIPFLDFVSLTCKNCIAMVSSRYNSFFVPSFYNVTVAVYIYTIQNWGSHALEKLHISIEIGITTERGWFYRVEVSPAKYNGS